MRRQRFRLSQWQLALLGFTVGLGAGPLTSTGAAITTLGRQAWMAALPAAAAGIAGVAVAVALSRRAPGRTFDRAVLRLLPPYAGYPYLVVLALLLAATAAVNLHLFVLASATALLPHMPAVYPALLIAAAGAFAAYFGPEIVGRSAEVVMLVALPMLALAYLAVFANAHWAWLAPALTPPVPAAAPWRLAVMAGATPGFLPLLLLVPLGRPPVRTGGLIAAIGGAGLLLAASLAEPVAVFGAPFVSNLHYPFLTAVGTVSWGWLPIQRVVAPLVLVWQGLAFVAFAICLWGAAWLLARTFRRLPWAALVTVLAAVCVTAAALSYNGVDEQRLLDAWMLGSFGAGVAVPAALLLSRRGPVA